LFNKSYQLAVEYNEDNLAVDAAHMVAIAEENLEKKMEWNLIAVKIAENSQQTKAYNWLGSLYNNIGWTYHDRGEYLEALHIFKKALAFREKKAEFSAIRIAKWCIARTHRSLNNIDEAIEMQLGLEKELDAVSEKDGYVYEELGELFLLKNSKDQFRKYFALAYIELSKDDWFVKNEGSRLERIKELGEIP
jgi:tetratricopeptide (TPR) repeat protein